MTTAFRAIAQLEPRAEGWVWWIVLVLCLALFLLIVGLLRHRLVRPMHHTPSDTTDAWTEAGRRLQTPPPGEDADETPEDSAE